MLAQGPPNQKLEEACCELPAKLSEALETLGNLKMGLFLSFVGCWGWGGAFVGGSQPYFFPFVTIIPSLFFHPHKMKCSQIHCLVVVTQDILLDL